MTNMENELNEARRFAIEHMRHTNRVFWTRVGALLTVNSLLVAGFAVLYTYHDNSATPLLKAIAVCGCLIQFTWLIFAFSSYPNFKYLRRLVSNVENSKTEPNDKEEFRKFWSNYEKECKDFYFKCFCKPFQMIWKIPLWLLWTMPKHLLESLHKSSKDKKSQNASTDDSRLVDLLKNTLFSYPAGIITTGLFFSIFFAIWIYAAMAAFDC